MKTFERADQSGARGFTLLEVLVVLAIVSIISAVIAGGVIARAPQFAVEAAANDLLIDLKRARLAAEMSGESVEVSGLSNGYLIEALAIERSARRGVRYSWDGRDSATVTLGENIRQPGARIAISKGGARATIDIAPLSSEVLRAF